MAGGHGMLTEFSQDLVTQGFKLQLLTLTHLPRQVCMNSFWASTNSQFFGAIVKGTRLMASAIQIKFTTL